MPNWPHSQEINEAVQMPRAAFTDPDLRDGNVVVGPAGLPRPSSGNFADVYQIRGADGREWAVKCFTRPVTELGPRYAAVDRYLAEAKLPFTVGFSYLDQGMRINGQMVPIVKMQWVEGKQVHTFVRANLGRASVLEALLNLWVRLCRRLRETGMAHCDLQHGNVLLVPGANRSLQLKLVDYDGMYVPELAGVPTTETGHSSYQHPERVAQGIYSADLDRFPHLVVATAIRGLLVGGQGLWDRYDNGDNLLFTEADFKHPAQSKLLHELWNSGDPYLMGLVTHLVIATTRPMSQTPWLDLLIPEGRPPAVTPRQEAEAAHILGLAPPVAASDSSTAHPVLAQPVVRQSDPFAVLDHQAASFRANEHDFEPSPIAKTKKKAKGSPIVPIAFGVGGLLLVVMIAAGLFFAMKGGSEKVADPDPNPVIIAEVKPKIKPPGVVEQPAKVDPIEGVDLPPVKVDVEAADPLEFRKLWTLKSDKPNPYSLKLTPDNKLLLRVPMVEGGTIDVLDIATGTRISQSPAYENPPVVGVAANGHAFSVADSEPWIVVWEVATGKGLGRLPVPNGDNDYQQLDVGNDSHFALLTRSQDAVILDLNDGGKVVPGFDDLKAGQCLLNPAGDAIITVKDGIDEIRIRPLPGNSMTDETIPTPWKNAKEIKLHQWTEKTLVIERIETSDDSRSIATFDLPGHVVTWAVGGTASGYKPTKTPIFISNDDQATLYERGSGTKTTLIVNIRNSVKRPESTTEFDGKVSDIALSQTGNRVFVQGEKGQTVAYAIVPPGSEMVNNVPAMDSPGFTKQWTATIDDPTPGKLHISRDGEKFVRVAQSGSGTIWDFDTTTGQQTAQFKEYSQPPLVDFKDGENLYSLGDEPKIISRVVGQEKIYGSGTMSEGAEGYGELHVSPSRRTFLLRGGSKPPLVVGLGGTEIPGFGGLLNIKTLMDSTGEHLLTSTDPEGKIFEIRPLPGNNDPVQTITWDTSLVGRFDQWSNDRRYVANRVDYDSDKTIAFNVADFQEKQQTTVYKRLPQAANARFRFNDDGTIGVLYVGPTEENPDPRLLAFRVENWETPYAEMKLDFNATDIALSPAGDRVIVHGDAGQLVSYALGKTGTTVASVPTPPATIPPTMTPNATDTRLPIPDDKKIQEALDFLHTRYKDKYDNRTRNVRFDLTQTLLKEANRIQDDPAMRYALYTEAESVGAALREPGVVLEAVRGLAERFQIDKAHYLSETLQKMVNGGTKLTQTAIITAAALEAETAIDAHDYKGARELYDTAQVAAKRGNMPKEYNQAGSRLSAINDIKQRYEAFQKAEETLKTQPNSADAHLAIGEYLCFNRNEWDAGIKSLAQGSNDLLRKLAEGEANVNNDSLALGVAWNDAAKSVNEDVRHFYEGRARYWLSRAAEGKVGITRDRIAEKLRFREGKSNYEPGLELSWQFRDNLGKATRGKAPVAKIDFTGDYFVQNQTVAQGTLFKVDVVWSGVIIPPHPGRYKIQVETNSDAAIKWDGNLIYAFTQSMIGNPNAPNPNLDQVLFDEPIELAIRWEGYASLGYYLRLNLVDENGVATPIPPEWFYHEVK